MNLYCEYDNKTGKILGVSTFERGNSVIVDFGDYDYLADKSGDGIYNFKIAENQAIEIEEDEQRELYPFLFATDDTERKEQEEHLNQMMLASMRVSFLNNLPDEQAKDIPYCYTPWGDYADGYEFTENKERVEYKGGLWKCKKTHKKQASWYPGADPTLFEQLDKYQHAGTQEDPIPVPDSVTTSGFTYEYGKYYSEAGKTYLCKRGGIEEPESMYGQKETLYFSPSALIGTYFEMSK